MPRKRTPRSIVRIEEHHQRLALSGLRAANRHGHGEAAGQQDHGVGGAQANVERAAARLKRGRIERAINRIGREQPAEEHDFGDQEHPDSERVGLVLLLEVLELMGHGWAICCLTGDDCGVRFRQGRPPASRSRKARRSRSECSQNFPSEAERASAIRGRWRPTDSGPRSARSAWTR